STLTCFTLLLSLGAYAAPSTDSVLPSSGSGTTQTFTFSYSDSTGAASLSEVYGLFNWTLSNWSACEFLYSAPLNRIYLINDAGTGWLAAAAPGAVGVLQNSQCALDTSKSSVFGTGNSLVLTISLTFKAALRGSNTVFLYAASNSGLISGWQNRGTWTVTAGSSQPPTVDSVSPSSGSGTTRTFTISYSVPNVPTYLSDFDVLFNFITQLKDCFELVLYLPSNGLFLLDLVSPGLVVPAALWFPRALQIIQCVLESAISSFAGSGNTFNLTV